MADVNPQIPIQRIYEDVLANLGNRTDINVERIYRIIFYSELAIARITKWKDFTSMGEIAHETWSETDHKQAQRILLPYTTVSGVPVKKTLKAILTFHLEDSTHDVYQRLRRVASAVTWQNMRMERLSTSTQRDRPTHYYFHGKGNDLVGIDLFPVPDQAYTYSYSAIFFPMIYYGTAEYNEQLALTIASAEDIVTARATYLLALGLQLADIAAVWKSEYNDMLKDLFLSEKDSGVLDMAAFSQEVNLNNGSSWWNDPFAKKSPGGLMLGDQV